MISYIIIAVVIMLVVLVLTLISISKGYSYKHTIDPIPEENNEELETKKTQ